jgi:hypothetical protein
VAETWADALIGMTWAAAEGALAARGMRPAEAAGGAGWQAGWAGQPAGWAGQPAGLQAGPGSGGGPPAGGPGAAAGSPGDAVARYLVRMTGRLRSGTELRVVRVRWLPSDRLELVCGGFLPPPAPGSRDAEVRA